MRISAKVDYAVRALVGLAASDDPLTGEALASQQDIPFHFLENILKDLRRAGIVASQRGAVGGYRMKADPSTVTVADVIRAVEGPLADVRGLAPEDLTYAGPVQPLRDVWIANRASIRAVLEHVSIAQIASDRLPASVRRLVDEPGARARRPGPA